MRHHLALPSDLRQRCWQPPPGSSSRLKSSGWGVGGRGASGPSPRSSAHDGAKTRSWRRSSAHAATSSGAVALFDATRGSAMKKRLTVQQTSTHNLSEPVVVIVIALKSVCECAQHTKSCKCSTLIASACVPPCTVYL